MRLSQPRSELLLLFVLLLLFFFLFLAFLFLGVRLLFCLLLRRRFFVHGDDRARDGVHGHFGDVLATRRGDVEGPDQLALLLFETAFLDRAARHFGERRCLGFGFRDLGLGFHLGLVAALFFGHAGGQ